MPDAVVQRVAQAIRNGDLRPGERIVEADLARKLGVSRGPLREALNALRVAQLLESRPHRGTYVAHPRPGQAEQMTQVRASLEGLAARLVAGRRCADTLARLGALHRRIETAAGAGKTALWRDLDWDFHRAVCQASGNAVLLHAWNGISDQVRLFLHAHPAFERNTESVLRNHEMMLAALVSGDPDQAEETFRSIILRSGYSRLRAELPPSLERLVAFQSADSLPTGQAGNGDAGHA